MKFANAHSIWGQVDNEHCVAPGIWIVGTASHGGVILSPERLAQIPEAVRETAYSHGGQFEEDQDWAIPRLVFDAEFSECERCCGRDPAALRAAAIRTLQNASSEALREFGEQFEHETTSVVPANRNSGLSP